MPEYTPTTEDVRDAYAVGAMNWRAREVNFDRWLAARDRENRAIGWDEGWVNRASRSLFGPVSVPEPPRGLNPYRGDTT